MLLGSDPYINRFKLLNSPPLLHTDGSPILFVDSVSSLGVVLKSKLNWKGYIAKITGTVHSILYCPYFVIESTVLELRKRLIITLGFPHLDYCSVALCDS